MNLMTLMDRFGQSPSRQTGKPDAVFAQYEARAPHHQNAVDLLPGWTGSFPAEYGVTAGHLALHADPRIAWMIEKVGPLAGKRIAEIGPLEGMHTAMLDREKPAVVDAVEANRLCYLRCLVTSQIMKLQNANFLLGDALEFLAAPGERYDLIVASGVLYHMSDPVRFLELAAARCDALFLWTHCFDPAAMPEGDIRRQPFTGHEAVRHARGMDVRLYERNYRNTSGNASFCGGPKDRHYWMHRHDILDFLRVLGFTSIEIDGDDPAHPGGPCFSVLARRL